MHVQRPSRYAAALCFAAALLAGCGGSPPPIGAPGTMPQSHAVAQHAGRGKSWMLPQAKNDDLLYLASEGPDVYIYSYPQRKLVGTIANLDGSGEGGCVDSSGNVFLTREGASGSSVIYEYAHGGTGPIETLSDPALAYGCSVDPTTGNLAVANIWDQNNPYHKYNGDLAVYADAQGSPQMYYPDTDQYDGFHYCGYAKNGDLYLSATDEYTSDTNLVRLSRGTSDFETITLPTKLYPYSSSIQWLGETLMVSSEGWRQPLEVYKLRISGSTAKVISSSELSGPNNNFMGQVWFESKTVIGLGYHQRSGTAYFWRYPAGGSPSHTIEGGDLKSQRLFGAVVSPSHSPRRDREY